MELSMWNLYGWLENRRLRPAAQIQDGAPRLTGVRRRDQNTHGPGPAAVLSARRLVGGGGYRTAVSNDQDRIFLPDADGETVQNCLSEAFEFYGQWERDMLRCLVEGKSLQQMLEVAHRAFHRPMFIKSDGSWVFAITPGYSAQVHPDWARLEESVVSHEANFSAVKAVSTDPEFQKVFTQTYPIIVKSPVYEGMVLRTNVWLEGHRVCEIMALENGKPFHPGDAHLMNCFAQMVEQYAARNSELFLARATLSSFFVELLESGECDTLNRPVVFQNTGWREEDELVVTVVDAHARCETPIMSVFRERLSEQVEYACVFLYNGQLVCITDITRGGGYQENIRRLEQLLPTDVFIWGASYEFTGMENIPEYYRQAQMVVRAAMEEGASHAAMYQVACRCLAEELHKERRLDSFIHPDLKKLEEVDRKGDSHYAQTLLEYLLCGGNYTDTAGRMGLHRNSLIYRISRVREIVSSDLDDPQNRRLLIYSYMLRGYC